MLKLSNEDVLDTLRKFRAKGVKVSFLVPTPTGLAKSIMDATDDIRGFLQKSGIHDFEEQAQGPENKSLIPTTLISGEAVISTKTSLYRPLTKSGDPRIWIYELGKHAGPGDLLALTRGTHGLAVINCSRTNVERFLDRSVAKPIPSTGAQARRYQLGGASPEWTIREPSVRELIFSDVSASETYLELLGKLEMVSSRGYVRTLRPGDTGVGYTLESMLGIAANSSTSPDYKGIEVKSGRARTHRSGQTTVFSQVPDWRISRLKSSKDLLWARGKFHPTKERQQLFHEISAISPNSYGLQLEIDYPEELLHQVFISGGGKDTDVSWALGKLKDRLNEKHRETVWVTAQSKGENETEEFWYNRLKHTDQVDVDALPLMLETGAITVHYTIKETPSGGTKDQGYLFKTSAKNLDLLFAKVEEVTL